MKIVNPTAPLAGFRNHIRNGNFQVNQRGVTGTVTLAANAYGHDGVKAGASGATYTFATIGLDTTLTVSAGSIVLPIEGSLIEGSTYVLSQTGTAQARVYQASAGAYASCPLVIAGLTPGSNVFVEFSTGTIALVQLEAGPIATAFERRPVGVELMLCQRYYTLLTNLALTSPAAANFGVSLPLFVPMRATPTASVVGTPTYSNGNGVNVVGNSPGVVQAYFAATAANGFVANLNIALSAEL